MFEARVTELCLFWGFQKLYIVLSISSVRVSRTVNTGHVLFEIWTTGSPNLVRDANNEFNTLTCKWLHIYTYVSLTCSKISGNATKRCWKETTLKDFVWLKGTWYAFNKYSLTLKMMSFIWHGFAVFIYLLSNIIFFDIVIIAYNYLSGEI